MRCKLKRKRDGIQVREMIPKYFDHYHIIETNTGDSRLYPLKLNYITVLRFADPLASRPVTIFEEN